MTRGMARDHHDLEKQIQKQMGCMAGFLHIFDRHHMLAGKRIYSAKTLPPGSDTSPEPENNNAVSDVESTHAPSTPERVTQPPTPEATTPRPKTPVPLPAFEVKEGTRSPWKFSREAPRLSLDSRAVVDAKGALHPRQIRASSNNNNTPQSPAADVDKQRRSTSVIARLMGLDEPSQDSDPEPELKSELRRSASESRLPRDLNLNQYQYQYRFFDPNGFQLKQLSSRDSASSGNNADNFLDTNAFSKRNGRFSDPKAFTVRNAKAEPTRANINIRNRGAVQRKSFYDSADIFPDTKQHSASIYGEFDRRVKMRGIDEPSKDLETLKQILEAVQLKGLLHSRNYESTINNHRNLLLERNDSPIVLMKPGRPYGSALYRTGRLGNDSPPPSSFGYSPRARRNNEILLSPRRETDNGNMRAVSQARARSLCSATRGESEMRSPNRMRKVSGDSGGINRGVAPVRVSSRTVAPEQHVTSRSPRMRRGTFQKEHKAAMGAAEDAYSTVSESSFSTCSQTDTERLKIEENREGRSLLERCDKLLNSIAEITASGQGESQQPSPVSVLDSSFYKESSSCSPSPVMKRCIDYKEQAGDSEDEMWNAALWCSEDTDFLYVSEILRACNHLPEDSDIFLLLEKQQYLKGNDTSKASTLRRRLIFDTVREILHRNRRLPPWKEASWAENTELLRRIWTEFRRIRGREEEEEVSEELFEVICGVLRKDVAEEGVDEWGERHVEMGDVVLDMERLVFKDLIGETIRELAWLRKPQFNKSISVSAYRRKLLF
ncbi:protein LONGIFOLIA 2 [Arachis duranensis]|uniref:Protein LONGIFOLIA 2 n=1 Tax=Arachis duranensis TaxID=130453 RepID=A0A6P4DR83_ARADU|nr:protein LONGIFOLIA 2 [Arachis duranensis]